MKTITVELNDLVVNPDNDRHGPTGSEDSAIFWLLENRTSQMKAIAKSIAKHGRLLDFPLVVKNEGKYIVKDGNRRVASMKLLMAPSRATAKLRDFYLDLKTQFPNIDYEIICQVESDELADEIVDIRHNGTRDGVGQAQWDVRAKSNYRKRLKKKIDYDWSEAFETILRDNKEYALVKSFTRSNLDKLLKADKRRKRLGLTYQSADDMARDNSNPTLLGLAKRFARDMSTGDFTLHNVLNSKGMDAYVGTLLDDGVKVLPATTQTEKHEPKSQPQLFKPQKLPTPQRKNLIPQLNFEISWGPQQTKIQLLWEELQFHLNLTEHRMAVAVCFRVLIEQISENFRKKHSLPDQRILAANLKANVEYLNNRGLFDTKCFRDICRLCDDKNAISSIENLQRILHSPTQMPSPTDMISFWDSIQPALVAQLKQTK